MPESLRRNKQPSRIISEEHFAAYLSAGLQMPVSHFSLNLAHLRAITTNADPATYFGDFFASTLTDQQLAKVGQVMNRAHRSAGVAVLTTSLCVSEPSESTITIDPSVFEEGWQISKAHTIRSLLSYINNTSIELPEDPTDLLNNENEMVIRNFLADPNNAGEITDIAFIASRAQTCLRKNPVTQVLKREYMMSLHGDSTDAKRQVKRSIASVLRQEFPDTDIQWLFKEPQTDA